MSGYRVIVIFDDEAYDEAYKWFIESLKIKGKRSANWDKIDDNGDPVYESDFDAT